MSNKNKKNLFFNNNKNSFWLITRRLSKIRLIGYRRPALLQQANAKYVTKNMP